MSGENSNFLQETSTENPIESAILHVVSEQSTFLYST